MQNKWGIQPRYQRSSRRVLFLMCIEFFHAKKMLETFHLDSHILSRWDPAFKTISSSFFVLPVTLLSSISTSNVPALVFDILHNGTINTIFLAVWLDWRVCQMRTYRDHPKKNVKNFMWGIPLLVSEGHFHLGLCQEKHWLSPGHAKAYGKNKLYHRILALERRTSVISRGYRRIWTLLKTFLHTVTWKIIIKLWKDFFCRKDVLCNAIYL